MSFLKDLEGSIKSVENAVALLKKDGFEVLTTRGNYHFDIIATSNNKTFTVEVKSHPLSRKTNNIAYEIFNIDTQKPSGIMSSPADYWVDEYVNNEETTAKKVETKLLKTYIGNLLKLGKARLTVGGDGNRMILVIVPIKEITW